MDTDLNSLHDSLEEIKDLYQMKRLSREQLEGILFRLVDMQPTSLTEYRKREEAIGAIDKLIDSDAE